MQRLKRFDPASGYRSWSAGENLIYNRSAIDAHVALRAWLDSSPHRENMLDPSWREVGVGSLHASSAGGTFAGRPTWVITIDFGARTGPVVKTAVGVVQKTDDTKAHAKQTTRLRRSMPA